MRREDGPLRGYTRLRLRFPTRAGYRWLSARHTPRNPPWPPHRREARARFPPIESSNTRRGCVRRDEGEYQRGVPGGACGDSATASARTARGVVRARGFASEGDTHGIHGERRRHRRSRGNVDHFGGRPRADGAADGSPPLVTTGPTVSLKELPPRLSCAGGAPPVCPTGHHGLRDCHRGAFE